MGLEMRVYLMEALNGTTWNNTKRTMFIIEGLVSVGWAGGGGGGEDAAHDC
jgi:hypothetical protein